MNQYDYTGNTNQGIYTARTRTGTLTVTPTKLILQSGHIQREILIHEITGITYARAARWWEAIFNPWYSLMYGRMKFSYYGGASTTVKSIGFTRKQEQGILYAKGLIEYYQSAFQPRNPPIYGYSV